MILPMSLPDRQRAAQMSPIPYPVAAEWPGRHAWGDLLWPGTHLLPGEATDAKVSAREQRSRAKRPRAEALRRHIEAERKRKARLAHHLAMAGLNQKGK